MALSQRLPGTSKRFLRGSAPKTYDRLKQLRNERSKRNDPLRREIDGLLRDRRPPEAFDTEAVLQDLQSRYPPFPIYGYDRASIDKRAAERSDLLIEIVPALGTSGRTVFEAGSGDSVVALALSHKGHAATVMDSEDWRDERAKILPFIQGDVSKPVPVESSSVDLCYSFNAFEHVGDPRAMFLEMLRILKPGGYFYLDFNPLYASPWGMHLYRTFRMPYCQFLFSHEFLLKTKAGLGANDIGEVDEPVVFLNKWRPSEFFNLWKRNRACAVLFCETTLNTDHLDIVREFASAFRGRGLTYEDVTTSGIKVLLHKK